jgi:hypothetical protein
MWGRAAWTRFLFFVFFYHDHLIRLVHDAMFCSVYLPPLCLQMTLFICHAVQLHTPATCEVECFDGAHKTKFLNDGGRIVIEVIAL